MADFEIIDPFDRQRPLIDEKTQNNLGDMRVIVIGAGTAGLLPVVTAAMMGVGWGKQGYIEVHDGDQISKTNSHRLIGATQGNIGKLKTELVKQLTDFKNSDFKLNVFDNFLDLDWLEEHLVNLECRNMSPHFIISAFDQIHLFPKLHRLAQKYGINVILSTDVDDNAITDVYKYSDRRTPLFNGLVSQKAMDLLDSAKSQDDISVAANRFLFEMIGVWNASPEILKAFKNIILNTKSGRREGNHFPQLIIAPLSVAANTLTIFRQYAADGFSLRNVKDRTINNNRLNVLNWFGRMKYRFAQLKAIVGLRLALRS